MDHHIHNLYNLSLDFNFYHWTDVFQTMVFGLTCGAHFLPLGKYWISDQNYHNIDKVQVIFLYYFYEQVL